MAKTQISTYAQASVSIPRLRSIGAGDEDVYSKSGRTTRTRVFSLDPTVDNNRTQIYLTVVYEVEEGRSDYTHLRGETTAIIQVENGSRIVRIGPNGKNVSFYREFRGEDHEWHDVTGDPGVQSSYFSFLRIKFDGKGDDTRGNAQLEGLVSIPVVLEIEQEGSTLPLDLLLRQTRFNSKLVPVRPFA